MIRIFMNRFEFSRQKFKLEILIYQNNDNINQDLLRISVFSSCYAFKRFFSLSDIWLDFKVSQGPVCHLEL